MHEILRGLNAPRLDELMKQQQQRQQKSAAADAPVPNRPGELAQPAAAAANPVPTTEAGSAAPSAARSVFSFGGVAEADNSMFGNGAAGRNSFFDSGSCGNNSMSGANQRQPIAEKRTSEDADKPEPETSSSGTRPRDRDSDNYNWRDELEDEAENLRDLREQVRQLDEEMIEVEDLTDKLKHTTLRFTESVAKDADQSEEGSYWAPPRNMSQFCPNFTEFVRNLGAGVGA